MMRAMLPSVRVTEVLDYFQPPELVAWRMRVGNREANKVMRDTAKVGERIDQLIKTGSNPNKKDNAEVHSAHAAYIKWVQVYAPKDFEVGVRRETPTDFCIVSGESDIITLRRLTDIKVTNSLRLKNWIQVNVYNWQREQAGFLATPEVAILRLDRTTGQYEYVVKPFDTSLVDVWLGLARAYLYYKGEANGDDGESGLPEVGSKQEVA